MIRVACPHCQRRYRTRTEGMGKTAVCTGCGQSFKIGAVRLPHEWESADLGEDSWIGVAAPPEHKEVKHCIICDAPLGDDKVWCTECGANQVTGIVHRMKARPEDVKVPFWSRLPLRGIVIVLILLAAGAGIYFAAKAMMQSVSETTERSVHMRIVRDAERLLQPGDDKAVRDKYAGHVNDDNLPAFIDMLDAQDPAIREAVVTLIGCGRFTNLQLVLELPDPRTVDLLLRRIGAERLVDISVDDREEARAAAARALCRLFSLDPTDENIEALAAPARRYERVDRLNVLCRPWPELVGRFVAIVNDVESPPITIRQLGRDFYLAIGSGEFASDPERPRAFRIPIEEWCAATGTTIDPARIRQLMTGSVDLAAPTGARWDGAITLTANQVLEDPLPGFLPFDAPEPRERLRVPIVLQRP